MSEKSFYRTVSWIIRLTILKYLPYTHQQKDCFTQKKQHHCSTEQNQQRLLRRYKAILTCESISHLIIEITAVYHRTCKAISLVCMIYLYFNGVFLEKIIQTRKVFA